MEWLGSQITMDLYLIRSFYLHISVISVSFIYAKRKQNNTKRREQKWKTTRYLLVPGWRSNDLQIASVGVK